MPSLSRGARPVDGHQSGESQKSVITADRVAPAQAIRARFAAVLLIPGEFLLLV